MPEQTYAIPPLKWKKTVAADAGAYWTASDGWGDFLVYSAAYERYLSRHQGEKTFRPRWNASYDERNIPYGGVRDTVAQCKSAAEAYHQERVASLLTPVKTWPSLPLPIAPRP